MLFRSVINESFGNVARATAISIAKEFAASRLSNTIRTATQGYGCAGGHIPMGLKDPDGNVYYGIGTVTVIHHAASRSTVNVSLRDMSREPV